MTKTQKLLGRSALSTGVLSLVLATAPAFAQDNAADDSSVIVVTGSRIARPDLDQASPIAVVTSQAFELKGQTNVESVLNDMPQVMASTTGTSNNPGGGVATVDLRGLGTARTLVLVNGRRYVSFDVTQVVDLNTVPQALIERVDVVTGGRSAVYGSDAIAGVVNFILKRDFEGIELGVTQELSGRGDGSRFDVNGTIGANFADGRGNVTLSLDYYKRKPIFAAARSYTRNSFNDLNDGTFVPGGSGSIPEGRIRIPGLNTALGFGGTDIFFSPDGSPNQYDSSANAYNTNPVNYLQVPQERFLMSARAQYEVSSGFRPYMEAQFVNNRVDNLLAATPVSNSTPFGSGLNAGSLGPITLQTNSPFFSPTLQNALNALDTDGDGYITSPVYGFRTIGLGGRLQQDERNAYRMVIGADGDIGGGWSYDGYYMYSRTKNSQRQSGNIALTNFKNALQTAFQDPTTGAVSATPIAGLPGGGTLVCASADARAAGCVPANLFGVGNLSGPAAAYLGIGATNLEQYTTQVASIAVTNSELFDLGAGGVGVALGAEWRSERGSTTPDTFLASGNVGGFNPGAPTAGGYSVREFFGEVNIPLLADTFVKKFEVNGAARYTHYSNAPGNVFTWAAGAQLQVVDDLTFRGQYQRAIRGPSVSELFLGQTVSFDGQSDPCGDSGLSQVIIDRCVANGVPLNLVGDSSVNDSNTVNPPSFQSGNANLREEKSKTFTVGGVFTPTFLRGFSATVDYYSIKVTGFINPYGQGNIFAGCFDAGIQSFCDLISRNELGQVDRIVDQSQNSGGLKTSGLDVGLVYSTALPFAMFDNEPKLSFSFNGTRVFKYDFTPVVGVPIVNECAGKFGVACSTSVPSGQPIPKWKHAFRTTLAAGPVTTSLQWRYQSAVRDDDPATDYAAERIKAYSYFDFALSADVNDNLRFTGTVSNLFDKRPPFVISQQTGGNGEQSNTLPSTYDVLGRYFSISARLRF
ncbi:TonB-dependent receptor domain-containing protein [Sphingomonas sp. KC8]|uniref:TonB-dependent receptor domain-containing protein n=1 Tax=Sphingomonas sp. KC8 TaxID=1030157 RepID=UPI000248A7E7|nr:TonB-dependent receptor [Sphingomonas sp. KC8]ARS27574.1 hypothetical protein KC8_09745 [Sphingomonas sp. KC8]